VATLFEKTRLLRGLLTGGLAHGGPFYVTVDVTRRCNLRCPGCRYHSSEISMPSPGNQSKMDIAYDLFTEMCDDLQTMGTRSVVLIGEGEPLLHPRLFDIIAAAKGAGLHVTLLTNGTLLDESKIQSLIDSRLDILKVSLWATSREEYVHNYPGSDRDNFERILHSLRLLDRAKAEQNSRYPLVVLHQPINRHNFQHVDSTIDLAYSNGCDSLSFSPFKTRRQALDSFALTPDEEERLIFTLKQMKGRLDSLAMGNNIDQTLLRYKIGEAVWEKLPCYIAWLQARVKVDGSVLPCNPCDLVMGNVREAGLKAIWNAAGFRNFRRQTMTREGLRRMAEHCDCGFCCHVEDNVRVHRFFRWFSPLFATQRR